MDDPNWFPDQTLKVTWLTRAYLLILFEKRLECSGASIVMAILDVIDLLRKKSSILRYREIFKISKLIFMKFFIAENFISLNLR